MMAIHCCRMIPSVGWKMTHSNQFSKRKYDGNQTGSNKDKSNISSAPRFGLKRSGEPDNMGPISSSAPEKKPDNINNQ